MSDTLEEIINRLWIAPDYGDWTPKTDMVSLTDVRQWFKSDDIEVLGFTKSKASKHSPAYRIGRLLQRAFPSQSGV
jgi:hypothetical protein